MTAATPGEGTDGFRKSSYSYANGNCVEVTSGWRKSRGSISNGACVEAASGGGTVAVRDTADRSGPVLEFPAGAWRVFLAGTAGGES